MSLMIALMCECCAEWLVTTSLQHASNLMTSVSTKSLLRFCEDWYKSLSDGERTLQFVRATPNTDVKPG